MKEKPDKVHNARTENSLDPLKGRDQGRQSYQWDKYIQTAEVKKDMDLEGEKKDQDKKKCLICGGVSRI